MYAKIIAFILAYIYLKYRYKKEIYIYERINGTRIS